MAFDPSDYKLKEQPGSGAKTGAGKVQFVFAGLRSTGKDAAAWAALKADADSYTQFRGYYIDLDSCRLDYSTHIWTLYIAGNETSGSTVTTCPAVGETIYRELLPNGLTVLVMPKPGFRRCFARFAVRYGVVRQLFFRVSYRMTQV